MREWGMADPKDFLFPGISSIVPKDLASLTRPTYLPVKTAEEIYLDNNLASEFHKRLRKWIEDYETGLDDAHEVGVRLVSFGQSVTFHLQDIGFWNPSLMRFYGLMEDGTPVELIQHVTQISILLTKLKRLDPSIPKRRIGFYGVEGNDNK
jgi:hypothetical protein